MRKYEKFVPWIVSIICFVIGASLWGNEAKAHGFPLTAPNIEPSISDRCSVNVHFFELVKSTENEGESCSARQVMSYIDLHQIYDNALIDPPSDETIKKALICESVFRIQHCGIPSAGGCSTLQSMIDEEPLELVENGYCNDWSPARFSITK